MHERLSRRALLRAAGLAGLAAGVGGGPASATPDGSDYETASGQTEPVYGRSDPEQHYVETNYTLPPGMDDTEPEESPVLFGEVVWPTDPETGEKRTDVPVVLTYSPYNDISSPQSEAVSIAADGTADYFVPRGYARAVFDVVGCRNSGGCYDYGGYRERITGKQLVEYLAGHGDAGGATPDGAEAGETIRKIGMIGGSYDGTTQLAAAVENPRGLAAIVPQVAIDRWYDYAYGGGIRYFLNNEYPTDEGFDTPLAFDFGFGFLPPANVDDPERFADAVDERFAPCERDVHTERAYEYDPVYDDFWERRDYRRRGENVDCAVLIEGGWLDHNVKHWDSTRFYRALPGSVDKKLVMGRWNHSASQFPDAQDLRHAWFDRYLKGLRTGVDSLPNVDTELNTGDRLQHERWPPEGTRELIVDLTRTDEGDAALALRGSGPPTYTDDAPLTEEEMFATDESGHSHLKFESAPLSEDLRISGSPLLEVLAASTMDSTHYTPVLYERLPDGSTEVITRGFWNARNRNGLDVSEPVPVGEPYAVPVELWDVDYLVREGHRLGLVVASDNRDWCLDDPDGHSTNEVILTAPGGAGGTTLRLPASRIPPELSVPDVSGERTDDGSVFTGGQTNRVDLSARADRPLELRDRVPPGWSVVEASGDVGGIEERADGSTVVSFDVEREKSLAVTYYAEAPDDPADSGRATFGPVEARGPNGGWVTVTGTGDENVVLGQETNLQ